MTFNTWNSLGTSECDENSVRLVGGNSSLEGLVEVCINGVWGRVCDRFWDKSAAIVVCGQLGHSVYGIYNVIEAHSPSLDRY